MPIGLSACRAEVDGTTVVTSHIPFSRQGLISFQAKFSREPQVWGGEGRLLIRLALLRNCLKNPDRPQTGVLRVLKNRPNNSIWPSGAIKHTVEKTFGDFSDRL
jgi:hypothetical protein